MNCERREKEEEQEPVYWYREVQPEGSGKLFYLLSEDAAYFLAGELADVSKGKRGFGATIRIGQVVEDRRFNILAGTPEGVSAMIRVMDREITRLEALKVRDGATKSPTRVS